MQDKLVNMFILLLFSFGLTAVRAQERIPASGGNVTGSGGSVSYTIGQIAYTSIVGANFSVEQGIQQPYEISVITGIPEAKDISLQCTVYPNPTTDNLKLHIENFNLANLMFQLYDMSGKLLLTSRIVSNETVILMRNYAPAFYFLIISDNQKKIKTFKIVKN
jgi:hypothetical protein